MSEKAVVIGAGLGGLAAASLLASRGLRVTVFEKNDTVGGKMQEFKKDGFRFDTGPSLFTMPFILENLFELCGESLQDYLTYEELSPICRYFYSDETVFDNYSDREKNFAEIEKFAPQEVKRYSEFLDRSEKLYDQTADAFLFNPLYDLSDLKGLKLTDFLGIDAFSTVSDKVDDYFESSYLRKFFKRFTTYNGSSPYQAPATLNVIPHVELNQGGYYVNGGMYNIARAMYHLAIKQGVSFKMGCTVQSIQTDGSKVTGIITASGEQVVADLFIANSDATDTLLNLLDKEAISNRKRNRQKRIEPSCSGFVLMMGVEKKWSHLRHHNIFFSEDYQKEFKQIFEEKVLPDDPTIYVANTSFTDSSHAPEGGSNLFVLVNSPYVTNDQNWEKLSDSYSTFLIDELERRSLTGLKEAVLFQKVITPEAFLKLYGSNKGSIYGTSSNNLFSAFIRPRNKVRGIENLFLVGGSTHPGGGIPLVVQSAFNAMKLIERSDS